jgi:hypothetical protein
MVSDLWAITSYFNPAQYRRRLANYRNFRRHLRIPLVTVELAYGPDFELQDGDADILVQLRGGAVLWQKERLLNLALGVLPAECSKVAWLDCDVIFETNEWYAAASRQLDEVLIVQLFRTAHYPPPEWAPGDGKLLTPTLTRQSAVDSIQNGVNPSTCFGFAEYDRRRTSATGLAWAARRELLDHHGFYDACIIGGGDNALICAASNCFEGLMQRHMMNEHEKKRYLEWGKPFCESVKGRIGCIDATLFHMWHGELSNRGGATRFLGLQPFRFDPATDIALDSKGLWRWNTAKPEMHEYLRQFFPSRREDGP